MPHMNIKEANFIGSYPMESLCPSPDRPEYAFIGRSNVGKSSLLNMLTGRKSLAKVSNTPGKTQAINYFEINRSWYMVDLPGYGFARISKKERERWEKMIEKYLVTRSSLVCAFVLIDIRHDLQKIDLEFINWLGERMIPFVMIFTKADKLKTDAKIEKHVLNINTELLQHWESLPQQFVTSSEKHMGKQEILDFIEDLNNKF